MNQPADGNDAAAGAGFDPHDLNSWFRGKLTRQQATNILNSEDQNGIFLVRDSTTCPGDYVLCVKEDHKISHYIINKMTNHGTTEVQYKIGDQMFADIPSVLQFYQLHYLDTTTLTRPAPEKVQGQYDFSGNDPEDLPFRKGDILTVVHKDEEQWWTCKNAEGKEGLIPVPYVRTYVPTEAPFPLHHPPKPSQSRPAPQPAMGNSTQPQTSVPNKPRKLPAQARVIMPRIPNAYDKTALVLKVGDIVTVYNDPISGTWEGEVNGQRGFFPFNYVRFLDEDEQKELDAGGANKQD